MNGNSGKFCELWEFLEREKERDRRDETGVFLFFITKSSSSSSPPLLIRRRRRPFFPRATAPPPTSPTTSDGSTDYLTDPKRGVAYSSCPRASAERDELGLLPPRAMPRPPAPLRATAPPSATSIVALTAYPTASDGSATCLADRQPLSVASHHLATCSTPELLFPQTRSHLWCYFTTRIYRD